MVTRTARRPARKPRLWWMIPQERVVAYGREVAARRTPWEAGDETDDAIDRAVTGIEPEAHTRDGTRMAIHRYSTDLDAATLLLSASLLDGARVVITGSHDAGEERFRWHVSLEGPGPDAWRCAGEAESLPLAISRALLDIDPGPEVT